MKEEGTWEMIFFAALCILGGFQQFIIEKTSPAFRKQYYVYSIHECLGCQRKYKDMRPGYVRRGKGSPSFYEGSVDAHHPSYCSEFCGKVMGSYSDSFDGWCENEN